MSMDQHIICKVKALAGLVSITFVLPAMAIEKPDTEGGGNDKRHHDVPADLIDPAAVGMPDKQAALSVACIGLGGAPVSETLAKHLGLEQGVGLTIHHVIEGAPADKIGIKKHDVLVEFDGQKIGGFEALRDAVRSKKPADEVEVAFIQEGVLKRKKAVLAERKIALGQANQLGADQENNPLWRGMGDLPKGEHDRMREMMKRRLDELGKQLEKEGEVHLDMKKFLTPDQFEEWQKLARPAPVPGKPQKMFNFNAQSSMTVMDDEGSVTIKVTDGHHEVMVKDKSGKVLFDGPYETPKDKAAVPDDVRGRIDNINFFKDMENGFRFEVKPKAEPEPELELEPGGANLPLGE